MSSLQLGEVDLWVFEDFLEDLATLAQLVETASQIAQSVILAHKGLPVHYELLLQLVDQLIRTSSTSGEVV